MQKWESESIMDHGKVDSSYLTEPGTVKLHGSKNGQNHSILLAILKVSVPGVEKEIAHMPVQGQLQMSG